MSLHIQIERFEGPLGLLLHLIRREEMDIFDINIHNITRQYLDYIKAMKKLDLEMAGEFVAMAATLIHIKSRLLLPNYNEEGEEDVSEDPRKELVKKLLDYQMYKEASEKLYDRPLVNRDVWLRGERLKLDHTPQEEIVVEENALFSLICAYREVLRSVTQKIHRVGQELQSIASRILEMKNILRMGETTSFQSFLKKDESSSETKLNQVLITFLSLLELGKLGFVSLFQSQNFDEIYVKTIKPIDRDVIARAETFDSHESVEESEMQVVMREETVAEDLLSPSVSNEQSLSDEQLELFEEEEGDSPVHHFESDIDFEVETEESLVEAATDEEIEAEERRLQSIDEGDKA